MCGVFPGEGRCCTANRTAQRISIYASRFGFLRALHLNIFDQPQDMGFFNDPILPDYLPAIRFLLGNFI
jgi:hypothetical protein